MALGFPSYDELPEDNRNLASVDVEFERLDDDSAASCPHLPESILQYLSFEVPGGDRLTWADLVFLRTARVGDDSYWIWRFPEPDGEAHAYVTASSGPGGDVVGYDVDDYGLTPEQFILATHHQVL